MKLPAYHSKEWKAAAEEAQRRQEAADRGFGNLLGDLYVKHCTVDGTPARWHHRFANFLSYQRQDWRRINRRAGRSDRA
jgi:hypothetical protein